MRELKKLILAVCLLLISGVVHAESAKITKVLPHFIDKRGRHATRPTLYDRDAYQAYLRAHPKQRSAIRFDVQWKTQQSDPSQLKLKLEMRGTGGKTLAAKTIEQPISSNDSSGWTAIEFSGDEYKNFGEVVAWRVTLWDGGKQIAEQKSFLW